MALDQASSAISAARMLLAQGSVIDLNGLEEHVDTACRSVADLPLPERVTMKPRLVSLIESLNRLTDDMTVQHKELSDALQGLGQRRQALGAYKPRGRR